MKLDQIPEDDADDQGCFDTFTEADEDARYDARSSHAERPRSARSITL